MTTTAVSWVAFAFSIAAILVSGSVATLTQRDKARFEARMTYELEARKSLLAVIGPLRFQLLLACRDVVSRVQQLGTGGPWNMDLDGYYARDTLFRMLRPIAIAELIERQINYVDFSVDPSMPSLLRFQLDAFECLTGPTPVRNADGDGDLAGVDWAAQSEHPFKGTLRAAATTLIADDKRLIRADDFSTVLDNKLDDENLATVAGYFHEFSPDRRPLFWLRLIFYAYVCQQFVADNGKAAGLATSPYPWTSLLAPARRDDVRALAAVVEKRMSAMRTRTLTS